MLFYLLLALLAFQTGQNAQEKIYFVNPPLPPTAHTGEYYTTQFRVIGLSDPIFSFNSLPSSLQGYPDGTLSGTPTTAGSFSLTIFYKGNGVQGSTQMVLRVVDSKDNQNPLATVANAQFIVVHPNITLTYIAGNFINIQFRANNGRQPYIWTFTNLPPGLMANIHGAVNGSFIQPGYYTFAASASDNAGNMADSFVTINVQPLGTKEQLVEVPSRSVQQEYDLAKIEAQQIQATKAVYIAIGQVYQTANITNRRRQQVTRTTKALYLASNQEKALQEKVKKLVEVRKLSQKLFLKAEEIIKNASYITDLALTNIRNAQNGAQESLQFAKKAQNKFIQSQQNLTQASQRFIKSQTDASKASLLVIQIISKSQDAYNVYNLTFKTYYQAKTILQQQLDRKYRADLVVDLSADEVGIATTINDNAMNHLVSSQDNYRKAINAFNSTLQTASRLMQQRKEIQYLLGISKFNLQQSKNRLFVAQAAKQQADKATAIVTVQSSTLPKDSVKSNFIGCQQGAYPSMAGSSTIKKMNSNGIQLWSDHILLYGSCTSKPSNLTPNDLISYNGFLKEGQIHALWIQKIAI